MRLRLIALCMPAVSWAGEQASVRVDTFDDGWITVVTPAAAVSIEEPTWTLAARGSVDVLSGATPVLVVDAVSSATSFRERRTDASLAVTSQPKPEWSVGAHAFVSTESDDRTVAGGVSWASELLDRRLTVDGAYTLTDRRTSAAWRDPRTERSVGHDVSAGASWIATRSTVIASRLALGGQWCDPLLGCAPSAYRYVGVRHDDGSAVVVHERHPDTRHHGAVSVRLAQAFGDHLGLHAALRGYADTWSILALTGSAGVAWEGLDDRLVLGLSARVTAQDAAAFYAPAYEVDEARLPSWTTADRELSGVQNNGLTGRAAWTWHGVGPFLQVVLSARVSHLWLTYPRFGAETGRNALVAGGGIHVQR